MATGWKLAENLQIQRSWVAVALRDEQPPNCRYGRQDGSFFSHGKKEKEMKEKKTALT